MARAAFFATLLLAAPVISLPVTNPTTQDDTKVMTCIAEVISNTVAKPIPLSVSQECLETLQGDERIRSILRHQNLLRELQEIAVQDLSEGTHSEKPTASLAELEEEKSFKSKQDVLKEEERNSLEEREPRIQDVDPGDEKENMAGFEGNEVDEMEGLPWSDAIDNHISDIREDEVLKQTHQEVEEVAEGFEGEDEHVFKDSQEERDSSVREQAEKEEEEKEEKDEEEEKEGDTSEEEHPTNSDNMDDQREDDSQDDDKNSSEEKDKYNMKGRRYHPLDGTRQDDDTSHDRDSKSGEMEKSPFQDVEDAKRWNKMDELAKQLTTTKRAEENESDEDPDRSMKMAFKSHNTFDFHDSPEEEARRVQKHHSKEEDSEQGFPLLPIPEEKKDEEGSANRRTEDQELESLAAIEAELEEVAHKLHTLRRG
ncbi:chromogranin-A isoform X2 [Candoia aspera]|uniref:chromogranin-A isoform X2 n=1 Tax=Candoia aspera TaxID=51853 RepID=UPI002FD87BAD